jgi:hypothetical protein
VAAYWVRLAFLAESNMENIKINQKTASMTHSVRVSLYEYEVEQKVNESTSKESVLLSEHFQLRGGKPDWRASDRNTTHKQILAKIINWSRLIDKLHMMPDKRRY